MAQHKIVVDIMRKRGFSTVPAILVVLILIVCSNSFARQVSVNRSKKIVLIAGPIDRGHQKGTHEYQKAILRFARDLKPIGDSLNFEIETHFNGWPENPKTLDDADTIVLVSNGSDRNETDHPFLVGDRREIVDRQARRGCGIVMIHWSTFWPEKHRNTMLDWTGGYFDYQTGAKPRMWYSKIKTFRGECLPAKNDHPILRGVKKFWLQEEFYYNIQFADQKKNAEWGTVTPILQTKTPDEQELQTIAWAYQRKTDSNQQLAGRGFAFTGGHFLNNWNNDQLRRTVENAILWTAHIDPPPRGVISKFQAIDRGRVDVLDQQKINVALISGRQHPAHLWRSTSEVLIDGLSADPRIAVDQRSIEFLADPKLQDYDVILFNYCNWEKPGLSDVSKNNFVTFLKRGGGLVLIHFANGAFHFSLPNAAKSDWPEYRNICRRVWDHSQGKSGHDAYGRFQVQIADQPHPITTGIRSFETRDELYFRQQGDQPIQVLATAKSTVTKQDEPMAFVYDYGRGRIFQTVLGHDAASLRIPSVAKLIRNAVAWTSRNKIASPIENKESILVSVDKDTKAFNARMGFLRIEGSQRLDRPPLSISCRARLNRKDNFNILVAKNPKTTANNRSNPSHWEFYTYAKTGELSFYIPGFQPAEIKSGLDVTDDKWHTLECQFDGKTVKMFVDEKLAKHQAVEKIDDETLTPVSGPLTIGNLASQQFGCAGLIDWVRIGDRQDNTDGRVFDESFGLWKFDQARSAAEIVDGSKGRQKTEFIQTSHAADYLAKWTPRSRQNSRFPYENEKEEDWTDDRFSKMDTGLTFHGSIKVPGRGMVPKAIALRSTDKKSAVLFNTQKLRFECAWTGDYLALPPQRFGVLQMPSVAGSVQSLCPDDSNWTWSKSKTTREPAKSPNRFVGMHRLKDMSVLEYEVDGIRFLDTLLFEAVGDKARVFRRAMEIEASKHDLRLKLFESKSKNEERVEVIQTLEHRKSSFTMYSWKNTDWVTHEADVDFVFEKNSVYLSIPASETKRLVSIAYAFDLSKGNAVARAKALQQITKNPLSPHLKRVIETRRVENRKRPIVTKGMIGKSDGPFAVDTITMPYQNQYRALMFASGFDFLPDGRGVLCTIHGDVWLVDGIDEDLDEITWQRYATGLYQPLGLKVVDGKPIVMCRDALTRLHDFNKDGHADFYESFNSDLVVTGQSHGYAMSLETDPEGNFYFIKSGGSPPHGGTMLKVTADGKKLEVFASGYRHANGMGISPSGIVTSADNEGNWIPSTRIDIVSKGGFYGHMPTHRRTVAPKIYDPPLCWLPREIDNSAGGQVWVESKSWGPLNGKMVHLSFGRCTANVVLPQQVDDAWQAAAYKFDLPNFLSGSMRGRFRPKDGHLYVCGLDGWQTAAVRDGCFQRVRATGKPMYLPSNFKVAKGSIQIQLTDPIERKSAEDISNWQIEQWNYRWSQDYGSDHFKLSQPDQIGHDRVPVDRVQLSDDQKTITLHMPSLQPVMQMNIKGKLRSTKGQAITIDIFNTINFVK